MKKTFLTFASSLLIVTAQAQSKGYNAEYVSKVHVGLGFGMDYGGLGLKAEYLPIKYVGVFAGLGFNFSDIGINGGVHLRPLPDKKIQPMAMFMYGYNGVIKIEGNNNQLQAVGLDGISKTYYGPSVGLGGELKVGKKDNRLYLGIWYPFRSKEFQDNYDKMMASHYLEVKNELLPITFSFGFNWAF